MLPADGRAGDVPEWPLTGATAHLRLPAELLSAIEDEDAKQKIIDRAEAEASAAFARELDLWAQEWGRPQAVEWERLGLQVEVALYVRSLAAAERPDAKVTLRTLVKQQQEALGISLPGLARNRWTIGNVAPAGEERRPSHAPSGGPARNRFRLVRGGGDDDGDGA